MSDSVTIKLGGNNAALKPSAAAAAAINRQFGGFTAAFTRVGAADLEAIAFIVAAGLGKATPAEIRKIEPQVYETGIVELAAPVSRYLNLLINGGRPSAEDETGAGEPDVAGAEQSPPS